MPPPLVGVYLFLLEKEASAVVLRSPLLELLLSFGTLELVAGRGSH